jgi:hypothetical protein
VISYYGYTISPNQLETGEGFLICRNVPIARTGTQQYLAREIGLEGSDVIDVERPEEEVFSPAAMASFEGKPVTNDHPTELVNPDNVSLYEKGHAQNVRRGSGEFEDFLVADLHIHDAELIDAVKVHGKRQISCGYECEYKQDENGRIYQINIRGNHIAIVDEGRAGAKAAIMDSINTTAEKAERTVKMSKKSALLKLFGLAANGKNEEELNQLALDTAEAFAEEKLDEEPAAEVEAKAEDEAPELGGLEAVSAKLDKLIDLLTPAEPEKAEVEVETKEDIDAAIEELAKAEEKTDAEEALAEADPTGEEAKVVEAEEMDACGEDACKDAAIDNATAAYILKSVREPIAKITDETQRKAVSDALISAVKGKKSVMGDILEAQTGYANTGKPVSNEDVQNAYAQMNPHTRKKED